MKTRIKANLSAASELGALIISGIYTIFYLSYVGRHFLEGRANSLAELYDRDSAITAAALTLAISALVFVYLVLTNQGAPQVRSSSARIDGTQTALATATLLALTIIYLSSPSTSYEGLHQHIGESNIGKLLYVPYIYYSYILAKGLEQTQPIQQSFTEFVLLSVGFTLLVPMRSPILTHALALLLIYRPPLKRFLLFSAVIVIAFLAIAIARTATGDADEDQLTDAIGMLIFGPSLQIDLYEIARADGYRSARDLYEFLATRYANYFDGGGGFGSFITLEIEQFLPGNGWAPILIALVPLGLRGLGRASLATNGLVVVAGIQSLTIIRNPISSWINGYIVSILFYALFRKFKSNR